MENLEITAFTRPTLTSVQLPTEEIGVATARHVLAFLAWRDRRAAYRVPVSLVERHSTGPIGDTHVHNHSDRRDLTRNRNT